MILTFTKIDEANNKITMENNIIHIADQIMDDITRETKISCSIMIKSRTCVAWNNLLIFITQVYIPTRVIILLYSYNTAVKPAYTRDTRTGPSKVFVLDR